jgi:serine phosphatase RsbU (regulator of sigma subunit)
LPPAVAARTGEVVLLKDRAAALAFAPGMADLCAATGREAWAVLPLRVGDRILGSLTASWAKPHVFDPEEVGLLGAFAAECGQSLARLQIREAEQRTAELSRKMSETLQRSLLTAPPQPDHLEIVVRYRSAAEQVQIGGDWYDAFLASDGAVCLVVGDVTGHDRTAAAVMGQVRNLSRGIGYTLGKPPGTVLSAVDRAMRDLEVDTLATVVLAQVEQAPAQAAAGTRLLRWANAGHPPPLLLRADGSSMLLDREPELLLGFDAGTDRTDHVQDLGPGDSVLLYTDGLVERRGVDHGDGLAWLLSAVADRAHLPPCELADSLLAEVDGTAEDDIALLLLRAHPEDESTSPD